jgi:hypothetical protein
LLFFNECSCNVPPLINPFRHVQNKAAIETLIGNDKAAKNSFRQKPLQFLPFEAFENVPESGKGEKEEKPFLFCAYNHAEKAYRNPYTNRFFFIEKTKDGEEIDIYEKEIAEDEKEIRGIESAANEVWNSYTELYYGHDAVGSAFFIPRGTKGSFEGIFGVHKRTDEKGAWDSVHVIQVEESNEFDKTCNYRVDSAVVMSICPYKQSTISCSLTKETVKTCNVRFSSLTGSHIENLGLIMEAVEIDFRSKLERVLIPKSMEVMESIYRKESGSGTVHLMNGMLGDDHKPSMATGMGVGAAMIGEIANKANSKKGAAGANPFMDAMNANLKARDEKEKKAKDEAHSSYTDTKTTLKKGVNPMAGEAMAAMKKKQNETNGEHTDLRAGLKKKAAAPKPVAPPANASPGAEFMDFRNKLKKTSRK